jgi:hypothetical protein
MFFHERDNGGGSNWIRPASVPFTPMKGGLGNPFSSGGNEGEFPSTDVKSVASIG